MSDLLTRLDELYAAASERRTASVHSATPAAKEARRKLGRFAVTHFREAVAALEWALGCLPAPQPPLTPESQYARELREAREVLRRIEEALR